MNITFGILCFLFSCVVSQFFCYFVLDDIVVNYNHFGLITYVLIRISITAYLSFIIWSIYKKRLNKPQIDLLFIVYTIFVLVLFFFKENLYTSADAAILLFSGNVILYIPLGFYIPFKFTNLRTSFVNLLFFLFPLFCESMQLISRVGVFDIKDIISDILGFYIGYAIYHYLVKKQSKKIT